MKTGEGYPRRASVVRASLVLFIRARYHGDSGQNGSPIVMQSGKKNCRAKGILYAAEDESVPVPLRIRLAASWPIPIKSCTPDVVSPLTSTGHISAANEDGIVRKPPSDRPFINLDS